MGFSIQTDHVIEAHTPDLVVVDKKRRTCKIIDFVVPEDSMVEAKERELVGFLGAIPKQSGNRLKEIGVTAQLRKFQIAVLLRILRKFLEV